MTVTAAHRHPELKALVTGRRGIMHSEMTHRKNILQNTLGKFAVI